MFLSRRRIFTMALTFVQRSGTGLRAATRRAPSSASKRWVTELIAVADDLSVWSQARPGDFFQKPDQAVIPSLQLVSNWASAEGYDPAAVNTFLQVADYYIVAQAHAHSHVVVTHEVVAHTIRRIKIPNACIGVGVKCVTPFEMLRTEKARFVLQP